MEDMYNDLMQLDIPIAGLLGILFVVVIVSLFHFVILSQIYGIPLNKYFFAVYPTVVLIAYFVYPPFAVLVGIFLFVSTFALAIIGIIFVAPFVNAKKNQSFVAHRELLTKGQNKAIKPKRTHWFLEGLKTLGITAGFFISIGLLGFVGVIIFFIVVAVLANYKKGANILKLQKSLPTSKIRSVAMGLAEVKGKIIIDEPLQSKIKKKRCAGYYYLIQDISRDKDGDESLTTIHTEWLYNPFYLEDETGRIKVLPDKLNVMKFSEDSYRSNGKKYTEYVIEEDTNKEYLMIGKVDNINGEPVLTYDEHKKILSITPVNAIEKYNEMSFYFNKVRPYFVMFLLWAAFILSSKVSVTSNGIRIVPHAYLQKSFNIFNKKQSTDSLSNETIQHSELDPVIIEIEKE